MTTLKRKVQYVEVAEKIRNGVRTGKYKPGTPIMSCRDMARTYNVSIKTVRNAVKMLVDENLLNPIQGGGTYVQGQPKAKRELCIGCAISSNSSSMNSTDFTQRLRYSGMAAIDYLMMHQCSIRHIPGIVVHDNAELREYIVNLDGLLISALDVNIDECIDLHKLPIPVVIFMAEFEFNKPFSQVIPDHYHAMRQALERLDTNEYSRLVIVHNEYANHIARRDAFAVCAREFGFSDDRIEFLESPLGEAYNSGLQIAEMPGKTLISTTSAMLTVPIYNALGDRSKKLGRDFEMIGYDSLDGHQTRFGSASAITTIDYTHTRAATIAAELLMKEIRGKRDFRQVVKLPTKLTVGTGQMIIEND